MLRSIKRNHADALGSDTADPDAYRIRHSFTDECDDEVDPRMRLEQFNRYFESVVSAQEELRITAASQEHQLKQSEAKFEGSCKIVTRLKMDLDARDDIIKELKQQAVEQTQALAEQHNAKVRDLDAEVQTLRSQIEVFEANRMESERTKDDQIDALQLQVQDLASTIRVAQHHFIDSITLEKNATPVPLTSGQFTNLEGLVRIWVYDDNFNGDVWFPFQCPLTKTTTAPVKDMSECCHFHCLVKCHLNDPFVPATVDLMSRLAASLGLDNTPPFFFRYRTSYLDNWTTYNLSDQIQLFSKLVLVYHRRHSNVSPCNDHTRTGSTEATCNRTLPSRSPSRIPPISSLATVRWSSRRMLTMDPSSCFDSRSTS
jgi:hypothetical protein